MDSTVNPPSLEDLVSNAYFPMKKNVTMESLSGKPLSSSTRVAAKGLLKRKIGSEKMVPPTSFESNDPVETHTSSALHDCPVIIDHGLKHVEDNTPLLKSDVHSIKFYSTSSSQMEVPLIVAISSKGLIGIEVSHPFSRGSITSALSAAEIFCQKLFGEKLGHFQATTMEATVVIANPLKWNLISLGLR
ncbi:unnamed protein product [Lactuca saligna]|uniref:Uncharacterized protein n=1 Tax=Lactuca saligna TaxID=75948 RepID=A0AA35VBX0_LACSI|nr:unnamed protein product [Lactuca saligna]